VYDGPRSVTAKERRRLDPPLDLEAQPLDDDLRGLLLTFTVDQRFDVALEEELMLASRAHLEMPINVGPLLVVYLPIEVEIEAG
jgi:hypothetical protein